MQLIDCIREKWKFINKKNNENVANLFTHDHHLIKGSRVILVHKLTSTKIYSMLILKVQNKPSSNICFENFFNDSVGWAAMYMLPHLVKHNTYMQSFQYKILNNILSLKNFFFLLLSVIYTAKHLFTYFMNVTVLNVYGRI